MSKNKGFARVEFLANLKKIKELTNQGYTKKAIYEQLYSEGKVSMTYIHFCRFDTASGTIRKASTSTPPTGIPAVRTVSALSKIPDSGGDGSSTDSQDNKLAFVHEKKVTEKKLNEELVGK